MFILHLQRCYLLMILKLEETVSCEFVLFTSEYYLHDKRGKMSRVCEAPNCERNQCSN